MGTTATDGKVKKVLLVDDEEPILDTLSDIIDYRNEDRMRHGGEFYRIFKCRNGAEALDVIASEKPDAVVSDVLMPDMDGLQLLAEINRTNLLIPVILITGSQSDQTVLRALRSGAYSYLTKPIDPIHFLDRLSQALDGYNEFQKIRVLSALPNWIELEVRICLNPRSLFDFFSKLQQGFSDKQLKLMGYAFEELLTNAVEWGNNYDPSKKVVVSYLETSRFVEYRIKDEGEGFDLEKLEHAAIGNPDPIKVHDRRKELGLRVGGFGLHTAHKIADELIYSEQRNQVAIVKYK